MRLILMPRSPKWRRALQIARLIAFLPTRWRNRCRKFYLAEGLKPAFKEYLGVPTVYVDLAGFGYPANKGGGH